MGVYGGENKELLDGYGVGACAPEVVPRGEILFFFLKIKNFRMDVGLVGVRVMPRRGGSRGVNILFLFLKIKNLRMDMELVGVPRAWVGWRGGWPRVKISFTNIFPRYTNSRNRSTSLKGLEMS